MKGKIVLFLILAIVLVGAIFSVFYFFNIEKETNRDNTLPNETQQQNQTSELQEGLPRKISVSTQEDLFREIRNAVNEHLNE